MGRKVSRTNKAHIPKNLVFWALFFGLAIPIANLTAQADQQVVVDRIAAVVGGKIILQSEVEAKIKRGTGITVSDYPSSTSDNNYERTLNDLINLKIISSAAKEQDIEITDEQLDNEISAFLAERGLDRPKINQLLANDGLTFDQYKEDFRLGMLMRRFQGRVLIPRIKVTDKDVQTYYLRKTGKSSEMITVDLAQIQIQLPTGASEEMKKAKRALSNEAYQKITAGMKFEDAAKIYSDSDSASTKGGRISGIKLRELGDQFRIAIETLKPGEITIPLETNTGIYMFQLIKMEFAGGSDFEASRKQLELELRNNELNEQLKTFLASERARTKIDLKN